MKFIYLSLLMSFLAPLLGIQSFNAEAAQTWTHSFTSTAADGSTTYEVVEVSISDDGDLEMRSLTLTVSESGDLIELCSESRTYSPEHILPTSTVKKCSIQTRLDEEGLYWGIESETRLYQTSKPLF